MSKEDMKARLAEQLKQQHYFWSFCEESLCEIPDDILIEKVLVYLDLEDIDKLFIIYPRRKVKSVWLHQLVPQGDYLHTLNRFLAWWYFDIKKPDTYLKQMTTRHLNSIAA